MILNVLHSAYCKALNIHGIKILRFDETDIHVLVHVNVGVHEKSKSHVIKKI